MRAFFIKFLDRTQVFNVMLKKPKQKFYLQDATPISIIIK